MGNGIAFKTDKTLKKSEFGVDKFIVIFPNGLMNELASGLDCGINIYRSSSSVPIDIRVFNGYVGTKSNMYETDYWLKDTTYDGTDVIRTFQLNSSFITSTFFWLHFTTGTTRIELLNCHNLITYGYSSSSYANTISEGVVNIEQYASLTATDITCTYNTAIKGNLSAFKNRTDITNVVLSGSRVSGDIANFKSSAEVGLVLLSFAYCTEVYGEITIILDAMKKRGVKDTTFTWHFYDSKVTYKKHPIGARGAKVFVFDSYGNYTLQGYDD